MVEMATIITIAIKVITSPYTITISALLLLFRFWKAIGRILQNWEGWKRLFQQDIKIERRSPGKKNLTYNNDKRKPRSELFPCYLRPRTYKTVLAAFIIILVCAHLFSIKPLMPPQNNDDTQYTQNNTDKNMSR